MKKVLRKRLGQIVPVYQWAADYKFPKRSIVEKEIEVVDEAQAFLDFGAAANSEFEALKKRLKEAEAKAKAEAAQE